MKLKRPKIVVVNAAMAPAEPGQFIEEQFTSLADGKKFSFIRQIPKDSRAYVVTAIIDDQMVGIVVMVKAGESIEEATLDEALTPRDITGHPVDLSNRNN